MISELLDHTERVLRHTPARSMPARLLLGTVASQAGVRVSLHRFVADIRARPDLFTVADHLPLDDVAAWYPDERAAYAAALRGGTGSAGPIIGLARFEPGISRQVGALDRAYAYDARAASANLTAEADVAAALHESLADLLRASGGDESLRRAVGGAVAELQAVWPAPDRPAPDRPAPASPANRRRR
jgi:hypothetical protein